MITFQDVLIRLQTFWADYGCVIWQPYNVQVGAGTMNPATFLRALGPEPWNVAYVEPTVRPDDGRYGDNPNRMQYYYQYQVILKPDPGNPQEVYLRSLDAIGIDRSQHDIRFVEDNWESPALGAWGLGWEVWLDGLEITQYTYFQQAGGMELSPNAVEITYGVERIVAALQRVDSVWDIQFNEHMTYGDIYKRAEWEHSTYYFEKADPAALVEVYNTYEQEAKRCLNHEPPLVLPAHDYVLKCSHLFNVLDARGAIGVVERADYFRRMQRLASGVARAFVAQRQEAGFPLVPESWNVDDESLMVTMPEGDTPPADEKTAPDHPAALLLEIGTEELPAADVDAAVTQLQEATPALLDEARLTYDTITVGGTPRRLTVQVTSLAPAQTPKEFVRRGPPVNRAYDEDGKPTRAAEGFARGQGVAVEDLEKQEIDGGHYVVARVHDEGQPTGDILAEQLPALIMGLRFGRSMQWNSSGVTFSRPIRWVVALLGEAVVPFSYAGVHSGRTTRGTRDADSPLLELENAEAYTAMLEAQGIILNRDTRRENIRQQVEATAEEAGGRVVDDLDLLDEVTNLVEQPTAVLGRFDEGFLDLPDIALMTVMRKHQRYFAVVDDDGNLMPMFVTVRNGGEAHLDKVAHGNEQVIRARFSDARFFFDEDVTQPLEAYLDGLDTLTFQEDLGSYREKAARLEGLSGRIGAMLGLGDEDLQKTIRAARLAKADLTTQMVVEMTSLQGEMGRIYALRGGEDPAVADAIAEHYMPTSTSGEVPPSDIGTAVALADRLDSLVGLFSVGLQPTGTSDPYALRRAALGIVQIALEKELDLSLSQLIKWAAQGYTGELGKEGVGKAAQQEVFTFMLERMRVLFREHFRYDVAEAVLSAAGDNPARAWLHAEQLDAWMQRDEWGYTLDQFARCVRITRSVEEDHTVNPDALTEDIERKLLGGIKKMEAERGAQPDVDSLLAALQPLLPVIETFFAPPDEGGVLVMAEDDAVRANRLGLLQRIARSAEGIADFSQLEGF